MKTRILKIFLTVFVLSIAVGDAWAESFTLKYEEEGPTFKGTIEGRGFKPNAPYILSINGKVGRDGNKTLLSYGKWSGEGYYDPEVRQGLCYMRKAILIRSLT
ncbi:MAG: hypothetical protein HY754_00230 [Nitrospirae bacterium]|nr:hypothetical protein [Nitrospirota bacterium]